MANAGARLAPYLFILLWSSSFVTARVGLALVSPLLFVAVRLVAATTLLGAVLAVRRQSLAPLRGRWHHLALAGVLLNGITLSAFHVGMVTENAAVMALMQTLSPLLIAISAVPLLGERLRRAVARPGSRRGRRAPGGRAAGPRGPAAWGAVLLGLVGAASLAGGTLYFGRFGRDVPLLPATAVQLGAAAILTVMLTIAFERPHAIWTPPAVAAVAWNVLGVSIGAMVLYYYMLRHGAAGRVAANFYLIPGTVAVLGWALLGERLTRRPRSASRSPRSECSWWRAVGRERRGQ